VSVESHWSAYYVSAGVAKHEGGRSWETAAKAHLEDYFDAVETEAQESMPDLGEWNALGTMKAWCIPNPWDHRPINRYRWAKKRRKA
jgi:hypothetical protein